MYAYKIKELAKRGTALLGAAGMLAGIGTSALPVLVSADALNPLTERSLTLSSSSPGWSYLDGSGNTTYAPPNSGANGQKTGNTYTFRMSSVSQSIKAMTFQYCTTPAGDCIAPGNNSSTFPTRGADDATHTDLNIVNNGSQRVMTSGEYTTVSGSADKTPAADGSEGNFVVLYGASAGGSGGMAYNAPSSTDWTWTSGSNLESPSPITGKNNFMVIKNTNGQTLSANTGDYFKVIFYGTNANYITNPGEGAFFVRINTYSDDTTLDDTTLVDGGVTVANVMNESITIQTKVLETMDFSVGVKDPNTLTNTQLAKAGRPALGQCSTLLMADPLDPTVTGAADDTAGTAAYNALPHNVLKLGDPSAEYSLKTTQAYTVDSYWRLSSNSSGGATIYYTGHTLTNTVGDEITPMNDTTPGGTASTPGTEQFGIGMVQNNNVLNYLVTGDSYGTSDGNPGTYNGTFADYVANGPSGAGPVDAYAHLPRLFPVVPGANYANAGETTPAYAFNANADTYAQPIATESTDVVNCVTAKMRYIANIAATTPAGIYTTKVNYVASPQY